MQFVFDAGERRLSQVLPGLGRWLHFSATDSIADFEVGRHRMEAMCVLAALGNLRSNAIFGSREKILRMYSRLGFVGPIWITRLSPRVRQYPLRSLCGQLSADNSALRIEKLAGLYKRIERRDLVIEISIFTTMPPAVLDTLQRLAAWLKKFYVMLKKF
jgi:hypothetical protein